MLKRLVVLSVLAVIIACVAGSVSGAAPKPAPKKESGSFDAVALPYPNGSYDDGSGCFYAPAPVHRFSHALESPFTGTLDVYIPQLTGDWDLFILDEKGEVITESSGSQGEPEHTTNRVKKGDAITVVACNWLGEPQVRVDYEFTSR